MTMAGCTKKMVGNGLRVRKEDVGLHIILSELNPEGPLCIWHSNSVSIKLLGKSY